MCISSISLLIVILAFSAHGNGLSPSDYNKRFEGEGTYYGKGDPINGQWELGSCSIRAPCPSWFNDYVPVAINIEQYWGMCGACLEVTCSGQGLGANPITGTFKAMVIVKCPGCKKGGMDLSTG